MIIFNVSNMNIVLASKSKFRKQALDLLGLDYDVIPSNIDEQSIRHSDPKILAKKLAMAKAEEVGKRLGGDHMVIAGDLFVLFEGTIYEKPKSEEEAIDMLSSFSGDQVEIISGVALFNPETGESDTALGQSRISFRDISQTEIEKYVASYSVLELAGAFERDGILKFSDEVNGDLSFLTGLPLNKLIQLLKENGIDI